MAQMQTLSIRIPEDDFQWLLSRPDTGANTPSEKLRALIIEAKEQEAGMTNPDRCLAWMRALVQPLSDEISAYERTHKSRSDILSTVLSFTPHMMSTLASSRLSPETPEKEAKEIEALLVQQCARLIVGVLRAAITRTPTSYDSKILDEILPEILEIATIIAHRKEPQHA